MAQRLLLVALLALAIGYVLTALNIPMDPWTAAETVNTRTLPVIYGALLSLVCIALLPGRAAQPATAFQGARWARLGGVVALIVGFLTLIQLVPFWVALGTLLAALAFWLGERSVVRLLLLSSSVPLAGWLGIEQLLDLRLSS